MLYLMKNKREKDSSRSEFSIKSKLESMLKEDTQHKKFRIL